MVILGQKTSAGIGADNVPVVVFSSADAVLQGGQGSVVAIAADAALKANPNLQLAIVPIPDGAGSAAVGTITVSGIASSTGSFEIWIGNKRIEITVNNGDAVNDIAISINTAITDAEFEMPITAGVVTDTVTLTARNKGLLGNNIAVSFRNNNIGTTDLTVVQPTTGTTDPSIATALTNIFPADYDTVLCTLNDATNLGLLKTHLTDQSAPTEDRPATGYFGYNGVQATVETLCGTTLNYERLSCAYLKYDNTTERGHSLDYEIGAAYASVVTGREDPALPFNNEALPGIAPSALESQLSRTQQESLLVNGVTPLQMAVGEVVQIVRAITTFTTDATGTKSTAWLDLNTILSMDFGKKAIEARQAQRFGQTKATDRVANALQTEIYDVIRLLSNLEIWKLVDIDRIIVEQDPNVPGRFNVQIPAEVVSGLHIIANRLDLILS